MSPKTWLLIRGLGRHTKHWQVFIEFLQGKVDNDVDVIGMDLPGMGQFAQQRSPLCIGDNVEFLRQQVPQLKIQSPLGVIAMSMGGMVAFEWALKYPTEVAALVLLNCSSADSAPFYKRLRWEIYPSFFGRVATSQGDLREQRALELLVNDKSKIPSAAAEWAEIERETPLDIINVLRQLTAAGRYKPKAKKLSVPTLLLVGAGDRFVNPQCSHRFARDWGLPLREHPWAGHDLTLDDPDWVWAKVESWLRGGVGLSNQWRNA